MSDGAPGIDPSNVPPEHGSRFGWMPVALVILALISSVLTPALLRVRERSIYREMEAVVNPARTLLAEKRSAMERSVFSHAAYLLSGNRVFIERENEWRRREA